MKKVLYLLFMGMIISSCNSGEELGKNVFPQVSHLVYSDNQLYGIKSLDEEVVVNAQFENSPTMVFDGLFFVIPNGEKEYALYNVNDVEKPIAKGFSSALPFTSETTIVAKNGGKDAYLIDKTGKEIKKLNLPDVVKIGPILDGAAIFVDKNQKKGVLSMEDLSLSDRRFDQCSNFSNGIALAIEGQNINYINRHGETIVNYSKNLTWNDVRDEDVSSFSSEWLPYVDDNTQTMGVKDVQGNIIIESGKYKRIGFIHDGFSVAWDGNKYCLINASGKEIITSEKSIRYFGNDIISYMTGSADTYEMKTINDKLILTTRNFAFDPFTGYISENDKVEGLKERKIYARDIHYLGVSWLKLFLPVKHTTNIELFNGIYIGDDIREHEANGTVWYSNEKERWFLTDKQGEIYGLPVYESETPIITHFNTYDDKITSMNLFVDIRLLVAYSGGEVIKPRYMEIAEILTKNLGRPQKSDYGRMEWIDGEKTVRLNLTFPSNDYPHIEVVIMDR